MGHTQHLLPLPEVPMDPAAGWDLLPYAQHYPEPAQAAAPPSLPPPGFIPSHSLQAELGPVFPTREPKSSEVTLPWGVRGVIMPCPCFCLSGHLLPSVSP